MVNNGNNGDNSNKNEDSNNNVISIIIIVIIVQNLQQIHQNNVLWLNVAPVSLLRTLSKYLPNICISLV